MPRYGPLLLVIAACAPNGSNSPTPPPSPAVFTFEMQTREMTYEDCVAGSDACTYIRLDYPAVVEVPVGASVEAVTSAIDSFLEAPLRPDEPPSGVNALMGRFLSTTPPSRHPSPNRSRAGFSSERLSSCGTRRSSSV